MRSCFGAEQSCTRKPGIIAEQSFYDRRRFFEKAAFCNPFIQRNDEKIPRTAHPAADGNYFGDAFRKHYGMSPRTYRLT